jgi:hypothetical protein
MKKTLLLIALFFATVSSSFAGQYIMSDSGFDSNGQSIEEGHAMYFTCNSFGGSYYTLTGNMYNPATTGEVFWYADCWARTYYSFYLDDWHFYYPYFDSSPSFYHVIGDVPYLGEVAVNIGVFGTDASITVNW